MMVEVLEGCASWLASQGLAQWSPALDYQQDPNRPAVLLSDADMPDTVVVLTVHNDLRGADQPGGLELQFKFRAPGRDPRKVEALADAVHQRFLDLAQVGPKDRLGIPAGTNLDWVSGQPNARDITLIERKRETEPAPAGKHSGPRFVRRDIYRVGVH